MAMRKLVTLCVWIALALSLGGCPKREQPPASSYDPDLVATAEELANSEDKQPVGNEQVDTPETKGECDRSTGGCADGFLCWDSWYCKSGDDTCSAMGDKLCHKICTGDSDCPAAMPRCAEKPIFKGSDRGHLEKFCVADK